MGILESAKTAMVICSRDRSRSRAFYRDMLGLPLVQEDDLAAIFETGGVALRVSVVADFTPHEHTIPGFTVPDVPATVKALQDKGLAFNRYPQMPHNELGIATIPGKSIQVAWCKDPSSNVLSITNA
jgi:catechol 2,3-dioxygenase-like lactoylglutathione lyase family enzyme